MKSLIENRAMYIAELVRSSSSADVATAGGYGFGAGYRQAILDAAKAIKAIPTRDAWEAQAMLSAISAISNLVTAEPARGPSEPTRNGQ